MYHLIIAIILGFSATFLGIASTVVGLNESISHGIKQGMSVAAGTIVAQTIWATISLFGVYWLASPQTSSSSFPLDNLIMGAVILYIAWKIYSEPTSTADKQPSASENKQRLIKNFITGFVLSISAPQRVILYIAVLTGFDIHFTLHTLWTNGINVVFGIILGIALWWFLFLLIIKQFQERINDQNIRYINYSGAVLLTLIALFSLVPVVSYLIAL